MRIVSVVGARPNFVKIGPLMMQMKRRPEFVPILVHTGQHYDELMSARFFHDLGIPAPDFNLGVGSGSHAVQTAEVMRGLEPILETTRPDVLLVVGDVNSTVAGALTAVKMGIPVAHVEAGLRSFDRSMPEEINRIVTDAISEFLFVTEESGKENLLREGRPPDRIHLVGNVMIDALEMCRPLWEASTVLARTGIDADQPYAVLTLHRPSNVDDPVILRRLLEALVRVARRCPVVFPVHPRVRERLAREGHTVPRASRPGDSPLAEGVTWLEPLGYLDFIALLSRASLVLTDSGGIQEETTALGVACLTLRQTTERPVTVTHGTNRVIGTNPEVIVQVALETLCHPARPTGSPPLWDGRAAERILNILASATR